MPKHTLMHETGRGSVACARSPTSRVARQIYVSNEPDLPKKLNLKNVLVARDVLDLFDVFDVFDA